MEPRAGNPGRDDKGEGGAHLSSRYRGMDRAAAGYLRSSSLRWAAGPSDQSVA